MSELKATTAQEIVQNEKDCDYMDELFGGVKMPPTQVYLKSEVDPVIARLKEQVSEERSAKVDYKISANDMSDGLKDASKEIRRLHRCIIRMTRQWLSAIDDMYSRLDDVHGLDDQDVADWDKVTELHDNLNKVLEKWK